MHCFSVIRNKFFVTECGARIFYLRCFVTHAHPVSRNHIFLSIYPFQDNERPLDIVPFIFAPLPIDLSDGGVITTPRLASNQPTKINICDILTEKKYCVFSHSVAFFFVARILHVAQRMRQKK